MPVTNPQTGTRIDEVAEQIYRISTPVPPTVVPGGFSFNQYLIIDDEPLLFHTGMRKTFPLVAEAIATVMPIGKLRWVGFSHAEPDENGALSDFLDAAPNAAALCGIIAAMVSAGDLGGRAPRALGNGEAISLGKKTVTWLDAPHVPHGWDCGFLFEQKTRTLFCGDLFTQGGAEHAPITESDILDASEAMRQAMDYYAHGPNTGVVLEQLAATQPTTLACMHGSAWHGDGAKLLRGLAKALAGG